VLRTPGVTARSPRPRRRHRPRRPLTAALALALLGPLAPLAGSGPPAEAQAAAPPSEHVVLIGFDGFDPDYLGRVPTPNIDVLRNRGASGVTEAIMLPITNPSFTALTTGALPPRNGNRAYWWDRAANAYRGQSRATNATSIAEAVVDAGGTVGSAQYFILQGNGTDYGRPGAVYTQPGGPCSRKFDDAIAMLQRRPVDSNGVRVPVEAIPDLLAVYCDDLDAIGHDQGADTPNIGRALRELDAQVGRLVAAIEEAGITDTTTIVLTGDHGMSTYTRSFFLPLHSALEAAGYKPAMLWENGQSVAADRDVVLISAGRSMTVYLAGARTGDAAALAEIRSIAAAIPGTGRILDRAAQAALDIHPDYGDLIIESEPGWGASILPPNGPQGDHGSAAERDAVFVIAGANIARTTGSVRVRHIDVAPTIAELLGLAPLPDADGTAQARLFGEPPPRDTWVPTTLPASSTTTAPATTSMAGGGGSVPGGVAPATPARPRRAAPSYTG